MNYIQELGTKALASRLKSLTELLLRDVVQIYKEQDIDFEPRWYTLILILSEKGEMTIMDIAVQLNQSHPAINQVANVLEKKGLIVSNKKEHDGRKRYLKLSKKGNWLLKKLIPIWQAIEKATSDFLLESDPELFDHIFQMESALKHKSMFQRIQLQIKKTQYKQIEIVSYASKFDAYFKSLNYEWLNKYFKVEESDEKTLSNPGLIINNGGIIYFANLENRIVGTVAIIHHQPQVCELCKMAVTEKYQGKQVGRKLLESAIEFAKKNDYKKIVLFSNPELTKAIDLYKSYGFLHSDSTDPIPYNYNRCTIQMELNLNT